MYSILYASGRWDLLARELGYRYPLERRIAPGDYESKILTEISKSLAPPQGRSFGGVVVEAFRSYLFNRALTRAVEEGRSLWSLGESAASVVCGGYTYRVPVARLPSRTLLGSHTGWSRLVARVMEEEGVEPGILPLRGGLRPLIYPVCRYSCRRLGDSEVSIRLHLPPGAFATTALLALYSILWIDSYLECM